MNLDILETVAGCFFLKQPVNAQEVQRAYRLADVVNSRLPGWARQNWRWEILHLRAVLDSDRFGGGGGKVLIKADNEDKASKAAAILEEHKA